LHKVVQQLQPHIWGVEPARLQTKQQNVAKDMTSDMSHENLFLTAPQCTKSREVWHALDENLAMLVGQGKG
jgi:hypothetical protein